MRKFMKGFMTFAVASAVTAGLSVTAAAEDTTPANLPLQFTFDYANQTLTVASDEDSVIGFATTTVKTKNEKVTVNAVKDTAWEWYDNTTSTGFSEGVKIDLSTLSNVKDNYIEIKGNVNTTAQIFKIPATTAKVKAIYEAGTGKVYLWDTAKSDAAPIPNISYRTQYGENWQQYSNSVNLSSYAARGASLTFRANASATEVIKTEEDLPTETVANLEDTSLKVYVVGSFPGKEVKVKITKTGAAPTATINYAKGTIGIPKGAVYRIVPNGKDGADYNNLAWSEAVSAKGYVVPADDFNAAIATGGVVETQTAATAFSGTGVAMKSGKPASKIGRYRFSQVETTYVGTELTSEDKAKIEAEAENEADAWANVENKGPLDVAEKKSDLITEKTIAAIKSKLAASTDITKAYVTDSTYSEDEAKKLVTISLVKSTDKKKGITKVTNVAFTNNDQDLKQYAVYVSENSNGTELSSAGTIKTAATQKVNKVNVYKEAKATNIAAAKLDGKFVYIGEVADAKASRWATVPVLIGKFTKPADVQAASKVTISADKATIEVGETITLTATVKPDATTNKTVKWTSADATIATVVENTGVVKGIAEGKVKITATTTDGSEKKAEYEITVTKKTETTVAVEKVEISGTTTTGKAGDEITLTATVAPSNATNSTVTWSATYGDESTSIEITDGVFTIPTGLEADTEITVTATAGGKTSEPYIITVEADE